MLDTTRDAVNAVLRADPLVPPADRTRLVALLRNHGKTTPEPTTTKPRIIRRREAAHRLGCSLRAVDNWTKAGILRKVTLPGRTRACGFLESEITELIQAGGAR